MDTAVLTLARKGQKVLRGVLVANAVLILIGLARTTSMVVSGVIPLGAFSALSFGLPMLATVLKLALSIPVYRGSRIARALFLILVAYGLVNFVPYLIRSWHQFSFSIFLQTATSLVVMGWLLYSLLLDPRVKAYFAALEAGTDLREKPLEEMIGEIGSDE